MAKDIKINSDGTIPTENGDLIIISGAEEVEQSLRIRLRMYLGEWFLDNRLGVPYFEEILIKNYSLNRIAQIIRGIILETQHVINIISYSQEIVTETENGVKMDKLSVNFTVNTEFGEININEVLQ